MSSESSAEPQAEQQGAKHRLDPVAAAKLTHLLTANPPTRGRTTDAVTDALREAISDGTLVPNSWIREDDLAAILQVSRTPIREAIRRLADEGLIVKTAHHGSVVASMNLDDILSLYAVRETLEGLTARLAVLNSDPGRLAEQLAEAHERMIAASEDGKVPDVVEANLTFHRVLRAGARNPYLERFMLQIESAVRRLPRSTFADPGRQPRAIEEHERILAAARAGDADAAEQAAQQHMRNAKKARLETYLRS